ncbi:hypothetical protein TYRP_004700 [Tyrophagus putrescentiae]|nr:hypothetical protein TYRP_004700 [Tyrophagus putrescentiae]
MIYRLISSDLNIPSQVLEEGKTLVLGRNRECKIKDLKCPRNYATVQAEGSKVLVNFTKSDDCQRFKSGQTITGPGFAFLVKIVNTDSQRNENDETKSTDNTSDLTVQWTEDETKRIIVGKFRGGGQASPLIASFDFDYTLVVPKSGKTYPVDGSDWKLLDSRLPKFFSDYVEKGYRLVVVSNQGGIEKGKVNVNEVKKRFNDSIVALGQPCLVLIATHDDIFRKPRIGLWSYLSEELQPSVDIDFERSFYVGDAAGRKKSALRKADHSCADLLFAVNAKLNFMLPEQFMSCAAKGATMCNQSKSLLSQIDCFKPSEERDNAEQFILREVATGAKVTSLQTVLPTQLHCIIFSGMSATGKSSFYRRHLKQLNYVYISRDEMNCAMSKCESLAEKTLSASQNVVIDNTSVDKTSRAKWIQVCKDRRAIPIIFHFKLPLKHIFHNNVYRKLTTAQSTVTSVLIYTQNKRFEEPTASEGATVFEVNFVPTFTSEEQRTLYYMYLTEK